MRCGHWSWSGIGIVSSGANAQIINCTITAGAGGTGGASSTSAAGGNGGSGAAGINCTGANAMIADCNIMTGAGGPGGANTLTAAGANGGTAGHGGNGINASSSPLQIINCSILTGVGGAGGNSSATTGLTAIPGTGGAGGPDILQPDDHITGCYIEPGAGGNAGLNPVVGRAGVQAVQGDLVFNSHLLPFGMAIKSCIIRLNSGGTGGYQHHPVHRLLWEVLVAMVLPHFLI